MKKKSKKRKSSVRKSNFSYYQVICKLNKFNYGAFPPTREGLDLARFWAEKMSEEIGIRCVVEKR